MTATVRLGGELVIDVDGFEGPLSLLLELARGGRIDLKQISMLALAEQYLAFVERAHAQQLELAAEYLVMAAWLAYLKSRLLLPVPPAEPGPSAADLAEALAFRLRRLEAMRAGAAALFDRPLLGRDRFARGAPGLPERLPAPFSATLAALLSAYRDQRQQAAPLLRIAAPVYLTVADAVERLSAMLGLGGEWRPLMSFLPPQWREPAARTSAIAAYFTAGLELAKAGKLELAQDRAFGPIMVKATGR